MPEKRTAEQLRFLSEGGAARRWRRAGGRAGGRRRPFPSLSPSSAPRAPASSLTRAAPDEKKKKKSEHIIKEGATWRLCRQPLKVNSRPLPLPFIRPSEESEGFGGSGGGGEGASSSLETSRICLTRRINLAASRPPARRRRTRGGESLPRSVADIYYFNAMSFRRSCDKAQGK